MNKMATSDDRSCENAKVTHDSIANNLEIQPVAEADSRMYVYEFNPIVMHLYANKVIITVIVYAHCII